MNPNQYFKNLSVPEGNIDVILDTDTYNEIDDQFALSYLLKNKEKLNVKAVTAAPFLNSKSTSPCDGMQKSYEEIKKIIKLCKREELLGLVYKGSDRFLENEQTPVISEASEKIVELAREHSPEKPLYLVAIGAITNIASALLIDSSVAENVVIVWLGGNSLDYGSTDEFNMIQDIAAARVVFESSAPFVMLPCLGVVHTFTVTKYELEECLVGKNDLSNYLATNTIEYMKQYTKSKLWTKIIWDVTAIGWLLNENERFMMSRVTERFIPEYDKRYSQKVPGKYMRYVYFIKRDALMEDLFDKLLKE